MALIPAVLILIALSSVAASSPPSVYEVIQSYGFPAGLLPQGVTAYDLDAATGKFTVYLDETCSFSVEGYNLKYSTKISGTISTGKITNLEGIKVKVLFFWLNISKVSIQGTKLELSVGIASAEFPVDNFTECPQCGCGFDCVTIIGFKNHLPVLEMW